MKLFLLPVLALATIAQTALAGSFGPGPWSNGAYYQGQFDGTYTATVYAPPEIQPDGAFSGTIISGVVGFALTGGSPRTIGSTVWDDSKNFYAIFANGITYTGVTLANINIDAKEVSGAFQPSYFTSGDATLISDFYGGSFTADINSDSAMFTFSGSGILAAGAILGGSPATATGGAEFEIYGIKVAN